MRKLPNEYAKLSGKDLKFLKMADEGFYCDRHSKKRWWLYTFPPALDQWHVYPTNLIVWLESMKVQDTWMSPPFLEAVTKNFMWISSDTRFEQYIFGIFPRTRRSYYFEHSEYSLASAGYALRILDWGDMMTYSLYSGHEPDSQTILIRKPIICGPRQ
jgi:hypothetical protein